MNPAMFRTLIALLAVQGCVSDTHSPDVEVAPSFVPLTDEPSPIRDSFDRAAAAGGGPNVYWVRSVRRVSDFRIGYEGANVVFPNAIEARLESAAGPRRGEMVLYRGAAVDGLCGYMEHDPMLHVCADVNFTPDGLAAGQLWAALAAPQGGPELGAISLMAGRRLPESTDPERALNDLESFLARQP